LNLSPLFSRISPVLKRRSPAHSPQRECAQDLLESAAPGSKTIPRDASNEELTVNDRVQRDGVLFNDSTVSHSTATEKCGLCFQSEIEIDQLKNEKVQLEKQTLKAREEVDRMSELVKDMERKWTEVAKDYEKQARILFLDITKINYVIINFIFN